MATESTMSSGSSPNISQSPNSALAGPVTTSTVGFNLSTAAASLKLDSSNYPYWRIHIESLLEGSGLLEYIQSPSNEPPVTLVATAGAAPQPNHAHVTWRRMDRWIFHLLFTSLTPSVASTISGKDTAKMVWDKLYVQFGKPSRGRVRQLKRSYYDLQRLSNQSVSDFAYMVKAKHDELVQLGEKLTTDDLNDLILSKLGDNYSELARALEVRDSPMEFEELIDRLITLQVPIASATPFGQASAFATAARPSYGFFNRAQPTMSSPWRPPHPSQQQVQPTPFPSQPSQPYANPQSARPPSNAPHRPFVPPRPDAHGRPRKPYQGHCLLCQAQGHSAKFCPTHYVPTSQFQSQFQTRPPRPQANTAVHQPSAFSPNWVLDSGSSHHVTSDLKNLSLHSPYAGTDGLVVGDGSPLPISHTGLPYSEPSPSWSS